jgi:hypothetical protein
MSTPLNLECPRCKQSLMVPASRTGSYVKCPRCSGSLWVPQEPAAGSGSGVVAPPSSVSPASYGAPKPAGGGGASSAPLPPGPPPSGTSGAHSKPHQSAQSAAISFPIFGAGQSAGPGPTPPVAPAPAPPGRPRKTARFISAETAQSTIKPAPDGKLPELRLEDKDRAVAEEGKSKSVSPLTLLAIISLSVAASLMLVFVDFEQSQGVNLERKAEARLYIERNYFPNVTDGTIDKNRKPANYQILLTDAQQAYARGDRKTERAKYNRLLDMLRAEREVFQKGLTGSPARDKDLEARITILLGPD